MCLKMIKFNTNCNNMFNILSNTNKNNSLSFTTKTI